MSILRRAAGCAALTFCAGYAHAGGIERSEQSAMILFESGNRVELSLGYVTGTLSGHSGANEVGNVSDPFYLPSVALKFDLGERWSAALVYERPFGADVVYGDESEMFGGTVAQASTNTLSAMARYSLTDRVSLFGGLRGQKAEGRIRLRGAAYGPVDGYSAELGEAWGMGYLLGAAYERPEIALRVALTYNSKITHDMKTTESGPEIPVDLNADGIPDLMVAALDGSSTTRVSTPPSWNLEVQSGVAPDTLVFGSVRYVHHSEFRVDAKQFYDVTGEGLIVLEDTVTYKIGLGRRFSERFSGAVAYTWEPPGDQLVSPLSPRTGYSALTLNGRYRLSEALTLSGGLSYLWLGDADPQTGGVSRADFEDNSAVGIGFRLAMTF